MGFVYTAALALLVGARVFFLTDSESRDENNHRAAEFRSIRKDGDEPWANA